MRALKCEASFTTETRCLNPRLPSCSHRHTFKGYVSCSQVLLPIAAEYALCKMFPLSHVVVSAGSRVPDKGLPGDAGPEAQVACRRTQSLTQLPQRSGEGGGCNLMVGHSLPAGLTPHKAAAQPCGATAFFPCPHGAGDGCSGLS